MTFPHLHPPPSDAPANPRDLPRLPNTKRAGASTGRRSGPSASDLVRQADMLLQMPCTASRFQVSPMATGSLPRVIDVFGMADSKARRIGDELIRSSLCRPLRPLFATTSTREGVPQHWQRSAFGSYRRTPAALPDGQNRCVETSAGFAAGCLVLVGGWAWPPPHMSRAPADSVCWILREGRDDVHTPPYRRDSSAYRFGSPRPCPLDRFANTIPRRPLTTTQSNRHDPGRCHKLWRWSWRISKVTEDNTNISVV